MNPNAPDSAATLGHRLEAAQDEAAQWPHADDAADAVELALAEPNNLHAERIVGLTLHGWSAIGGRAASCSVTLAQRALGRIVPDLQRPEIQAAHGLDDSGVGFAAQLGGLLQFAAMVPACSVLKLAQQGEGGVELEIDLKQHLAEALTFSPMRALLRPLSQPAGQVRSMRLLSPTEAAIVFEADRAATDPAPSIFIDLYQQGAGEALSRIARFAVELGGQLHDLEFRLLDMQRPLLMVFTDAERSIITTDCFPLPAIFAEALAPLVEYQVVLENGTQSFEAAAKIARSYFDGVLEARRENSPTGAPRHDNTTLILYARGATELPLKTLFAEYGAMAAQVVFLDHLGQTQAPDGRARPWAEFLSASRASHILLHDAEVRLRPDFWSVLHANAFRLTHAPDLIHWHSLWLDGVARPQLVKGGLLLHPAFAGHTLLEARSLLVSRAALERAQGAGADIFASGRLVLEQAFSAVAPDKVACVPVLMQIVRSPITPMQAQSFRNDHVSLPNQPTAAVPNKAGPGVSVIINYRDGVNETLCCLESLARQSLDGPLEVVLVNNGSAPTSTDAVLGRARELFGGDNVNAIDYPHRFNHSTQCNVGATAARHEMLLMLSNDSVLLTPRAVARAAAVASVAWVATCGFRIIGNRENKRRLQSLGLALTPRRHLFSGGSPLARNEVPTFALDCTLEVVGNTFAAVMLRRELYRQLDGLDSDAFPTNHNDVDFSFRAINAGYRHVAMGSEMVEHVGRGSREADQDLPIDQRIIERAPRLDTLVRVGFQQL